MLWLKGRTSTRVGGYGIKDEVDCTEDDAEKTSQAGPMSRIYKSADEVSICLGRERAFNSFDAEEVTIVGGARAESAGPAVMAFKLCTGRCSIMECQCLALLLILTRLSCIT